MRIVFLGSGSIALPTLQFLADSPEVDIAAIVTQPDRPSGRGRRNLVGPIKAEASLRRLPVLQPENLRTASEAQLLRELHPDLFVVMAYGQILSKEILEIPRLGPVNLHASLLPKHRGASPISAAILAGDPVSGITVMMMAEGLDTGDMILQKSLFLSANETAGSLEEKLAALAPLALAEAMPLLAGGQPPLTKQQETLATYAGKLRKADGWLNWQEQAIDLERKIRAFSPWPGCHTTIAIPGESPRPLKVWKATLQDVPEDSIPGAVFQANAQNGIVVATGRGGLGLREVQLEGRRRMSAGELLNGFLVPPGVILGTGRFTQS